MVKEEEARSTAARHYAFVAATAMVIGSFVYPVVSTPSLGRTVVTISNTSGAGLSR